MGASTEKREPGGGSGTKRNFFVYAASHGLTKLGDALMNPKTTLSWLGSALGAPTFLVAMLVPIREAGSLLLQVAVAGLIDRMRRRKWAWVAGSVVQGGCVGGMALVALRLEGLSAGLALVGLLALFATARSVCSLSSKDVLGRTVSEDRRGRAGGWASSAGGIATLVVAAGGLIWGGDGLRSMAWVLLCAAVAWWLAAGLFSAMREPADEGGGGGSAGLGRLSLLREDPRLRRFVITRTLLLCSALSAPYYVMLAQRHLKDVESGWLGFVLLAGLASLVGGPLWGRLADRSSRQTMLWGVALASLLGLGVFSVERWASPALAQWWLLPGAFFVLSIAHQGVRIGRKTWIVNIAEGQRRRDYVAVSNSAMGVMLLIVGGLAAALAEYSLSGVLLALTLLGAAGAVLARDLPEAESDPDEGG
ncbi:MFS transporter [Pseudomarimonas salicorniae]|uniref:MFS transporter n=1 Tax=Pseudomarimonas salicorniae TaxID=2933270 RepID=A0ABT0GE73_9GAMM|nr:MFS transporter [Lysobacter sp. CAU 1642]MCK7592738.1 MFS transporter [Lysobacter sp. CAU 1642]